MTTVTIDTDDIYEEVGMWHNDDKIELVEWVLNDLAEDQIHNILDIYLTGNSDSGKDAISNLAEAMAKEVGNSPTYLGMLKDELEYRFGGRLK